MAGTALLVVDVQVGVAARCPGNEPVVSQINALVERARAENAHVIWVQHNSSDLVASEPNWHIVPELQPAPGELIIQKRYGDSFADTNLHNELQAFGVQRIILTGAMSNNCIIRTMFGGLYHGYDVDLVAGAHFTADTVYNDVVLPAAQLVSMVDLNAAGNYLPGNRSRSVPINEVDFVSPSTPQ